MKRILPVILFFAWSIAAVVHAAAQDTTSFIYPRHQFKVNPLKPIGLVNPGLELAYELRYAKHFSTLVSGGVLGNFLDTAPYEAYSGYRFSLEQKYLYPVPALGFWLYPSLSAVYNTIDLEDVGMFIDTNNTAPAYEGYLDTFSMHKETFSVNANLGMVIPIRHFVIDISGGLGVKYRSITHHDRIEPRDILKTPRHPNVYHEAEKESNVPTMNVLLCIRVGYCF